MLCGNEPVAKNVSRPESPLKKKHNAVAYHKAREAIAADTTALAKEDGPAGIAGMLAKLLGGPTLERLAQMVMWRK